MTQLGDELRAASRCESGPGSRLSAGTDQPSWRRDVGFHPARPCDDVFDQVPVDAATARRSLEGATRGDEVVGSEHCRLRLEGVRGPAESRHVTHCSGVDHGLQHARQIGKEGADQLLLQLGVLASHEVGDPARELRPGWRWSSSLLAPPTTPAGTRASRWAGTSTGVVIAIATRSRTAASSARRSGLARKWSRPAAMHASRSLVMTLAVRATMHRTLVAHGRHDPTGGLEPVDLGHLHVHEDDVEASACRHLDRRPPVVCDRARMTHAVQQSAGELLVHGVVLGEQDREGAWGGGRDGRLVPFRGGSLPVDQCPAHRRRRGRAARGRSASTPSRSRRRRTMQDSNATSRCGAVDVSTMAGPPPVVVSLVTTFAVLSGCTARAIEHDHLDAQVGQWPRGDPRLPTTW